MVIAPLRAVAWGGLFLHRRCQAAERMQFTCESQLLIAARLGHTMRRLGAALVCASSFVIVRFESRSKEALSPVDLKAKDSARLEVAADSLWQRMEAGAGGRTARDTAGELEADGQLQLAEAWRGSLLAAANAARQGQDAEQHEEDERADERAPLVRSQHPRSAQ